MSHAVFIRLAAFLLCHGDKRQDILHILLLICPPYMSAFVSWFVCRKQYLHVLPLICHREQYSSLYVLLIPYDLHILLLICPPYMSAHVHGVLADGSKITYDMRPEERGLIYLWRLLGGWGLPVNPKPETRNPKHPKPETRNPKPETRKTRKRRYLFMAPPGRLGAQDKPETRSKPYNLHPTPYTLHPNLQP